MNRCNGSKKLLIRRIRKCIVYGRSYHSTPSHRAVTFKLPTLTYFRESNVVPPTAAINEQKTHLHLEQNNITVIQNSQFALFSVTFNFSKYYQNWSHFQIPPLNLSPITTVYFFKFLSKSNRYIFFFFFKHTLKT